MTAPDQAAAPRHPARRVLRSWPEKALVGAGGLCAGAAVGGLPGFAKSQFSVVVTLLALGVAAVALWGLASVIDWRRRATMNTRGTVFIIREEAGGWAADSASFRAFVEPLRTKFPAVRPVPGPVMLDRWLWPLEDGAERWGRRVDELVRSFRVVYSGTDPIMATSLMMWSWWPIGVAFAARLRAAEPDLSLTVRQRVSSTGRQGPILNIDPRQPALRFDPIADAPSLGALPLPLPSIAARVRIRLGMVAPTPLSATESKWPAQANICPRDSSAQSVANRTVHILLLRMTHQEWGPLPELTVETPARPVTSPVTLDIDDFAGIGCVGSLAAAVTEWRCTPRDRFHEWQELPVLAQAAADWIAKQATRHPDAVLLLGTTIPPDISLGIGIHAHRRSEHSWPADLWPLQFDRERKCFVIPGLNLGWRSLHNLNK